MHGRNIIKVKISGNEARFRDTDQVIYINMLNLKCLLDIQVEMLRKELKYMSLEIKKRDPDNTFRNQQQ